MNFFYDNWLSLWGTFGWWVMMSLTMLIGLLAGRRRWVQRVDELMPQIRRLTWWMLIVGLGCGIASRRSSSSIASPARRRSRSWAASATACRGSA